MNNWKNGKHASSQSYQIKYWTCLQVAHVQHQKWCIHFHSCRVTRFDSNLFIFIDVWVSETWLYTILPRTAIDPRNSSNINSTHCYSNRPINVTLYYLLGTKHSIEISNRCIKWHQIVYLNNADSPLYINKICFFEWFLKIGFVSENLFVLLVLDIFYPAINLIENHELKNCLSFGAYFSKSE